MSERSIISVERAAMAAFSEWMKANRPEGVPVDLPIVADYEAEPVARPYLCLEASEGEWVHRKWRKLRLSVVMRLRTDEDPGGPAPDDVAGWHVDLAGAVGDRENFAALQTALQPFGGWLRKVVEAPTLDQEEGDRGRQLRQDWILHVQIGVPGGTAWDGDAGITVGGGYGRFTHGGKGYKFNVYEDEETP